MHQGIYAGPTQPGGGGKPRRRAHDVDIATAAPECLVVPRASASCRCEDHPTHSPCSRGAEAKGSNEFLRGGRKTARGETGSPLDLALGR